MLQEQKGSRWAFEGDRCRGYPVADSRSVTGADGPLRGIDAEGILWQTAEVLQEQMGLWGGQMQRVSCDRQQKCYRSRWAFEGDRCRGYPVTDSRSVTGADGPLRGTDAEVILWQTAEVLQEQMGLWGGQMQRLSCDRQQITGPCWC